MALPQQDSTTISGSVAAWSAHEEDDPRASLSLTRKEFCYRATTAAKGERDPI